MNHEPLIPAQLHKETIKIIRNTIKSEPSMGEALASIRKTLEFEDVKNITSEGTEIQVHMYGTLYTWDYSKTARVAPIEA